MRGLKYPCFRLMFQVLLLLGDGTEGVVEGNMEETMTKKTYVVYDSQAMTLSPDDVAILLATDDQHQAIHHANEFSGVVYSYEVDPEGALINETLVHFGVDE